MGSPDLSLHTSPGFAAAFLMSSCTYRARSRLQSATVHRTASQQLGDAWQGQALAAGERQKRAHQMPSIRQQRIGEA